MVDSDNDKSKDRSLVSGLLANAPITRDRGQRIAIVVAGGRGGVGRSFLVANLGLYLARLSRRVMVIDLDVLGPSVHNYLGMHLRVPSPSTYVSGIGFRTERLKGTQLSLCGPVRSTAGYDTSGLMLEMIESANEAPADILIFDVGRAQVNWALDLYLDADVAITVSAPEPTAMEHAYGFLRSALFHLLLRPSSPCRESLKEILGSAMGEAMPTLRDVMELVRRTRGDEWTAYRAALADFSPGLVVNRCRSRSDREMIRGMIMGLNRRWGIDAIPLGSLDEDDVATQASRWCRPVLSTYPGSAIAAGLEQIGSAVANLIRVEGPKS